MIPLRSRGPRRRRLRIAAIVAGFAALLGCVLASGVLALGGDDLKASRATGGGGSAAAGDAYGLRSSIGQHDAGELTSGGYTLRGGILGGAYGVPGSGTVVPGSPSPTASASPTASVSPTASTTPGPVGPERRYMPHVSTDGVP